MKVDPVVSLRELADEYGLKVEDLQLGFEVCERNRVRVTDRHSIPLASGETGYLWSVPSLRALFRGDRELAVEDLERYPPEYVGIFYFIESLVLQTCEIEGDRTDQEMQKVYSALKRLPDGRSQGTLHDVMWRVAAFTLGRYVLSEQEFTAIFGRLERSARGWAVKPVSRNYIGFLRQQLG